jgi:hypothetical protein
VELWLSLAVISVPAGATVAATAGEAVVEGDGADPRGCNSCRSVAAEKSNAIESTGSRRVEDAYSNTIVPLGSRVAAEPPLIGGEYSSVTVLLGSTRGAAALGACTSGSARMKSSALWKRASGSLASERITASTIGCGIP